MFETLTERLTKSLRNLVGKGRLTEENIQEGLREVRIALIEADVALPVVLSFIQNIRERAIGQEVLKSLTPDQALIKVVHDELVKLLGDSTAEINLQTTPPAIILMAGLQGSGKTTTSAKLANLLKKRKNKNVMLVSTDIYRPAAIEQLRILSEEIDADFFPSDNTQTPVAIATAALSAAKIKGHDVVIIDTAGRLHIDEEMMQEIQELHAITKPIETLFVVDSMTGQDAANTAKAFNEALELTGVILTKIDSDTRAGAALSIKAITGKPIKFIGTGEKIDGLEIFHPDRIASRMLDMGDILSLVEEVQQKVDQKQAEKIAKKLQKGKFDLEDFRDQLSQMKNMGGMMGLMSKLPGMSSIPQAVKNQVDDKLFIKIEAMINSMTPQERRFPAVIRGSRKRRIAVGSGTQVQDVNRLLKQFEQMQKMMQKFSSPGKLAKLMRGMHAGMLPPGFK
ncbi:MAG: signal recognition particle protein [Gammaproteobacteria bacterium]